jgi:acetyl esterase/lipase
MTEAVVDQRTEVSVRARLTFAAARVVVRPLLTYWPLTTWGLAPLALLDTAARLLPAPRSVRYQKVDLDGFTGEWMRPKDAADGALLYFHGGAFVTCGIATHRHAVARIAEACGMPALSVAYRQLPAVPLAGSVADCLAAYRHVLAQGYHPDRIILAGDSAGGCLAFATALAAMADGIPRPAGIVALSPWLDFDSAAKLAHPNADRDAYAPVRRLPALAQLLGATEPASSPVNGQLAGLPPVLLITAESEMLRCDAELMARRLAEADVQVTLQIWAGQIHAFPVLGDLLPESTAAIQEIATFVHALSHTPSTALAC